MFEYGRHRVKVCPSDVSQILSSTKLPLSFRCFLVFQFFFCNLQVSDYLVQDNVPFVGIMYDFLVINYFNTFNGCIGKAVASYAEGCWFDSRQMLHRFVLCKWCSESTALYRVAVTSSQLDLPSLAPLSIAGFGRLQLAVH